MDILLIALLPFASTVTGGLAGFRFGHRIHALMALAAGVLVTTALVDLLPEATALLGADGGVAAGLAAVVGYLVFSGIEAFVEQGSYEHEPAVRPSPLGLVAPAGLIVHSLLDGLAIGLGFAVRPEVGLVVLAAVMAHDVADGMNVVALSARAGGQRLRASLLGLDAVAPAAGVVIGRSVPIDGRSLGLLLAGCAGIFLAIGAGHLWPESVHDRRVSRASAIGLAVTGAVVVAAIRTLVA